MKIFGLILIISTVVFGQTNVNIADGSGDGKYRGQRIVDVWADPAPDGTLFDRWTGDTSLLERIDEWNTKLKTGTKNINLTATYRTVASWTPSALENIGTSQMRYFFPAKPVGLVFHFHGSGGSANGLFNNFEQMLYARELVAAGYAIISLNSDDRDKRQWSNVLPPNNPDVNNVQAAIDEFISRGLITDETPIFASGISNGGGFAPRVSLFLNFTGTAIYIATSNTTVMSLTNTPTIWNIMEKDTVLNTGSVQRAKDSYNTLKGRGIRAEFNLLRPTPVYPERFWRIPGIGRTQSVEIYNALKSNGFLDGGNYLRENPQFSIWASVIPGQYNSFLPEIRDQLWICYTEHKFFSNFNRRVVKFFDSVR